MPKTDITFDMIGRNEKLLSALNESNKKLQDFKNKTKRQNEGLQGQFKKLGIIIAGAFAADSILSFVKESSKLAMEAEGIKNAFDRLNDPLLLNNLKTATEGMIGDMDLMKAAVRANNFKIPLDQLGTLLKFASDRAIDTGESVDYLSESIINGIARKSLPILDNLGLSAVEVREEFALTGDMAEAVGNIIKRSSEGAGDRVLTLKEKQAQYNATLQNMQVDLGNATNALKAKFMPALTELVEGLNLVLMKKEQLIRIGWDQALQFAVSEDTREIEAFVTRMKELGSVKDEDTLRTEQINRMLIEYHKILGGLAPSETKRAENLKSQILYLERYRDGLDDAGESNEEFASKADGINDTLQKQSDAVKVVTDAWAAAAQQVRDFAKAQLEADTLLYKDDEEEIDEDPITLKAIEDYRAQQEALKEAQETEKNMLEDLRKSWKLYGESIRDSLAMGASSWKEYGKSVLVVIRQMITAQVAKIITDALVAAFETAGSLGPYGLIAIPVLVGAALGLANTAISSIPSFATGGIVPGGSFTGDNVPAMVNSGEMILNRGQQSNLFNMLNSGRGTGEIIGTLKAEGTTLLAVIENTQRKNSYLG